MKKSLVSCFLVLFFLIFFPASLFAEPSASAPAKRPRVLMGTPPVNVNISGAGTLPEGVLFTALNASFADKDHARRGGKNNSDVFSQVWLLKVRYGLTKNLELAAISSYVNLDRSSPTPNPEHLEGFGDQVLGINYALKNIHQGDPYALSFVAGVMLPTAPGGRNHLPGNSAWGGRLGANFGKFITKDLKMDTELVWTGPFERGNQEVKRGDLFQWNTQFRYLFDNFDIAFESSLVRQESGNKDFPNGIRRNVKNGFTEWFVGPSMNVAFASLDMWAGLGVFVPVYQHVDGPNKVEDVRIEFKIGKLW